jgi:hypothetical protein
MSIIVRWNCIAANEQVLLQVGNSLNVQPGTNAD